MAGEPELQKGLSGEWVQYLQQCLAHHGYWNNATDGEFGEQLEQAVQQFQSAYGQATNGVVGQATWDILTGATSTSGGAGAEQGDRIHIDLSEIPMIHTLSQYPSEQGADQFLASLGIEKPSEGDEAYA
jgi:peptidoglycan hydrolase-like protein with peptidoglycan-binding domain